MTHQDEDFVVERVMAWVNQAVIGLNLCPFAATVVRQQSLRVKVSMEEDPTIALQTAVDELLSLHNPTASQRTTLVVTPHCLLDFDDFLAAVATLDDVIDRLGLRGHIQLAHFHPHYLFDGVADDDHSHWTNRAPYPILHLLREDDVAEALSRYPDAAAIPERNMARLRAMSLDEIRRLTGLLDMMG